MRRSLWIVPALAATIVAGPGRGTQVLAPVYKGQTAQEAGIVLGGWGSGSATESKDEALNGARSILAATEGYYSGARIDFIKPLDLSRYGGQNGVSMRFNIKFKSSTGGSTEAGGLAPGGGFFQGMPAGPPMPGGMPGGVPGRGYTGVTGQEEAPLTVATHALRVVLFSGNSRLAAVNLPVDPEINSNGWIGVDAPLAAFHGSGGTAAKWADFKVNRMLLFGDATDSFYIGDISIVQMDLSITDVSLGEDQEIAVGDTAEFTGSANGGAGLKFSWDFDSANGLSEDAIGRKVSFRYRKEGTYTVTLTVSDPTGVMKPVVKTATVKVNG
ncbi:MAG TPA: PKD domain-containing protein [Armatimonadota bacterium]